jgi:hypothetical protein
LAVAESADGKQIEVGRNLQAQAAAYQTARQAYAKALSATLNPIEQMGDKISFG